MFNPLLGLSALWNNPGFHLNLAKTINHDYGFELVKAPNTDIRSLSYDLIPQTELIYPDNMFLFELSKQSNEIARKTRRGVAQNVICSQAFYNNFSMHLMRNYKVVFDDDLPDDQFILAYSNDTTQRFGHHIDKPIVIHDGGIYIKPDYIKYFKVIKSIAA